MHDPLKQEEEKYKKYNHLFTANLKFLLNNKFFFLFLFLFFSTISKSALLSKEILER